MSDDRFLPGEVPESSDQDHKHSSSSDAKDSAAFVSVSQGDEIDHLVAFVSEHGTFRSDDEVNSQMLVLETVKDGLQRIMSVLDDSTRAFNTVIAKEKEQERKQSELNQNIVKCLFGFLYVIPVIGPVTGTFAQGGVNVITQYAGEFGKMIASESAPIASITSSSSRNVLDLKDEADAEYAHETGQTNINNQIWKLIARLNQQAKNTLKMISDKIINAPVTREEVLEAKAELKKKIRIKGTNPDDPMQITKKIEQMRQLRSKEALKEHYESYNVSVKEAMSQLGVNENDPRLVSFMRHLHRENFSRYLNRDYYNAASVNSMGSGHAIDRDEEVAPGFIPRARKKLDIRNNPVMFDVKNYPQSLASSDLSIRLLDPSPTGDSSFTQSSPVLRSAMGDKTRVGKPGLREALWTRHLPDELKKLHAELKIGFDGTYFGLPIGKFTPSYLHSGKIFGRWGSKTQNKNKMRDIWRSYAIIQNIFEMHGPIIPVLKTPQDISSAIQDIILAEGFYKNYVTYPGQNASPLFLLERVPDYKENFAKPEVINDLKDKINMGFIYRCLTLPIEINCEDDAEKLRNHLNKIIDFIQNNIKQGGVCVFDDRQIQQFREGGEEYINFQLRMAQKKEVLSYGKELDRLLSIPDSQGAVALTWGDHIYNLKGYLIPEIIKAEQAARSASLTSDEKGDEKKTPDVPRSNKYFDEMQKSIDKQATSEEKAKVAKGHARHPTLEISQLHSVVRADSESHEGKLFPLDPDVKVQRPTPVEGKRINVAPKPKSTEIESGQAERAQSAMDHPLQPSTHGILKRATLPSPLISPSGGKVEFLPTGKSVANKRRVTLKHMPSHRVVANTRQVAPAPQSPTSEHVDIPRTHTQRSAALPDSDGGSPEPDAKTTPRVFLGPRRSSSGSE